MSDIEDFGFIALDENDLSKIKSDINEKEIDERLRKMYDAIMPLLNNLRKNAEKDYIYWPNRIDKIDQFESKLYNIMTEGEK